MNTSTPVSALLSSHGLFQSHCCSLFQYIIFRIWSSEYLVTRTLNGLIPIRTVSCSVSHVTALNELNNSFPSFSDFKDYYQCSVTSVLLYQLQARLSGATCFTIACSHCSLHRHLGGSQNRATLVTQNTEDRKCGDGIAVRFLFITCLR